MLRSSASGTAHCGVWFWSKQELFYMVYSVVVPFNAFCYDAEYAPAAHGQEERKRRMPLNIMRYIPHFQKNF